MDLSPSRPCTAFAGQRLIASGSLREVALAAKRRLDSGETEPVLIVDNTTSELVEVDLCGTEEELAQRFADKPTPDEPIGDETPAAVRRRGRPRLGVVAREVTLLPRHWDWLAKQPGGASVALRKLVEQARRENDAADRQREAQQVLHRFMTALCGELPYYEEALRALYADDGEQFQAWISRWPADLKSHAGMLAEVVFSR